MCHPAVSITKHTNLFFNEFWCHFEFEAGAILFKKMSIDCAGVDLLDTVP